MVVAAPIVAQGVILHRLRMVALAERLDADRRAGRLLRRLRTRYGSGRQVREKARPLLAAADATGQLGWDGFSAAWWRTVRRSCIWAAPASQGLC